MFHHADKQTQTADANYDTLHYTFCKLDTHLFQYINRIDLSYCKLQDPYTSTKNYTPTLNIHTV